MATFTDMIAMFEGDPVIAYQPEGADGYNFAVDFEVTINSSGMPTVILQYESFGTEPLTIIDVYDVLEEKNSLDAEVQVISHTDWKKKWVTGVSDASDPEYGSVVVFLHEQ